MPQPKDKDALKITGQTRVKGGMEYDLKCAGVRLTLTVSPRTKDDDEDAFRVEARTKRTAGEELVVSAWGATRKEALCAAGQRWDSSIERHGFGMFDWEEVAATLDTVRAL